MFWRSPPVIPTHPPGSHGPPGAPHLCVSLVVDSASNFAESAKLDVIALTFSSSTIDRKKKIRYTTLYLCNRFFDNRNSDLCPRSESSKMRLEATLVALISYSICTESLILAQNERWRRT